MSGDAQQTTGWRPMPAPHDQRADLWHRDAYREPDCSYSVERRRHLGRRETGWTTRDGRTVPESEFTHWMPLPEPPHAE